VRRSDLVEQFENIALEIELLRSCLDDRDTVEVGARCGQLIERGDACERRNC